MTVKEVKNGANKEEGTKAQNSEESKGRKLVKVSVNLENDGHKPAVKIATKKRKKNKNVKASGTSNTSEKTKLKASDVGKTSKEKTDKLEKEEGRNSVEKKSTSNQKKTLKKKNAKKKTLKKVKAPSLLVAKPAKKEIVTKDHNASPKELPPNTGIERKVVEQAIEGVRILESKRRSNTERSKDIFEDDEEETTVYLQVGMLRLGELIRQNGDVIRPVKMKIYLPNSVVNSNSNVVLITKDSKGSKYLRADHSANLHHYQHRLRKCGAAKHITEVITLKQLKTEYKEYEAKRHLSNRTDLLLCDDTIVFRIPMFLGKHFYGKRKFPIPVNLKSRKLLSEVERCLKAQILWLPMTGDSGIMKIGRLDQSNEMIFENIKTAIEVMQNKFPGGWGNVQVLYLKGEKTKSVPFYLNLKSPNNVKKFYPDPIYSKTPVSGKLSSNFNTLVTVLPDNNVISSVDVARATASGKSTTRKWDQEVREVNRKFTQGLEARKRRTAERQQKTENVVDEQVVEKKRKKKKKREAVISDQGTDKNAQGNKEFENGELEAPDFSEFDTGPTRKKLKVTDREHKEMAPKKKESKGKKKKKEEDMDLGFDSDDDRAIEKLERDFLRSLKSKKISKKSSKGGKKAQNNDEYDDWAENTDDDMADLELDM